MKRSIEDSTVQRREFLSRGGRFALLGMVAPGLLAACAGDTDGDGAAPSGDTASTPNAIEGTPIVGDVTDFALTSEEWEGAFGFVTLRLHQALVDGGEVYFIRTDTSDRQLAGSEGLVFAPILEAFASPRLSGEMFLFDDDDHPAVLSSEPGRDDYTAAWRVSRVERTGSGGRIGSIDALRKAEQRGEVTIRPSKSILNAAVIKWSSGELPVDGDLKEYLGGGQLIEQPDTQGLEVTFKLHECFPEARYIVVDTSLEPMAVGMNVAHSPMLGGSSKAGGTGRTNVFMNGLEGPGPMGFQPSVFDSQAGAEEWSPYWDHMTYAWKKDDQARTLTTEAELHEVRDAGELEEFPGTPDTKGEIFTVNCPVPVIAPNTFTG
jgi:hypothetical protein